jgi:sugar O-acyltransferase (sialic acid O-acetyltransferase NeuD family)
LLKNGYAPNSLLIYGGGGHGKTLIELARALGSYDLAGVVDDHLTPGGDVLGVPVLGGQEILPELVSRGLHLVVNGVGGIGNFPVRWKVFELLKAAGFSFPAMIHPTAFIEPSVQVDEGVQVLPKTYIGSASQVGFGSVLNAGVIVTHDCVLGRCVNLSPGAMLAGGVIVKDFAQIGMGVTININITIGAEARVGNGATVKANVPPGGVVHAGAIWPAPGVKHMEDKHVS